MIDLAVTADADALGMHALYWVTIVTIRHTPCRSNCPNWEHVSSAAYGESCNLNCTVVLHVRDRRRVCNDRREYSRDAIPVNPFPQSADSDPITNAYWLRDDC